MRADNIKRFRNAKSLSMEQVRELTGLSKSTISDSENPNGNPTEKTLEKLAEVYEVRVDDFYKEDKETIIKQNSNFDLGTVKLNRIARYAKDLTESDQEVVLNVIEAMKKAKGIDDENDDTDKI